MILYLNIWSAKCLLIRLCMHSTSFWIPPESFCPFTEKKSHYFFSPKHVILNPQLLWAVTCTAISCERWAHQTAIVIVFALFPFTIKRHSIHLLGRAQSKQANYCVTLCHHQVVILNRLREHKSRCPLDHLLVDDWLLNDNTNTWMQGARQRKPSRSEFLKLTVGSRFSLQHCNTE